MVKLLVGLAIGALLLFMIAEFAFGQAAAVALTAVVGGLLGGGEGAAFGIVAGLLALVASAIVRMLLLGATEATADAHNPTVDIIPAHQSIPPPSGSPASIGPYRSAAPTLPTASVPTLPPHAAYLRDPNQERLGDRPAEYRSVRTHNVDSEEVRAPTRIIRRPPT